MLRVMLTVGWLWLGWYRVFCMLNGRENEAQDRDSV